LQRSTRKPDALDLGRAAGILLSLGYAVDFGGKAMRSFVIACAAALVVAIGAAVIMSSLNPSVEHSYSSPTGVRI
jgi:hypothetical protein